MRKRDLILLFLAIAVAAVLAGIIFSGSALETGSWGLSFRQEGAAPIGNAGADQLRQYNAAYIGDTSDHVLYLTFDAGYENGSTEKILDTLKQQNVKAAFFLAGNYIQRNADLVRRMAEEGHIVANHTMHHYDMSKISTMESFSKELSDLEALYKQATGRRCQNITGLHRGSTARRICVWQKNWVTRPCSGALRMLTGTTMPSPQRNRLFPSSCPGPTTVPWCCCIPLPKQMPQFWTNC